MTKSTEIDRLILVGGADVKDIIDVSVRKAMETQRLLQRYDNAAEQNAKYKRLAENFARASKKLEVSVRKFSEKQVAVRQPELSGMTQLRDMNLVPKPLGKLSSQQVPSSYEYISSMEEGNKAQTLVDLTRINKDMNSLQDMYYSLSEVASTQQASLIDSVQSKLAQASSTAKNTVTELTRATDRMDYWTKVKVYAAAGVTAVGLFFWVI